MSARINQRFVLSVGHCCVFPSSTAGTHSLHWKVIAPQLIATFSTCIVQIPLIPEIAVHSTLIAFSVATPMKFTTSLRHRCKRRCFCF